MPGLTQSAWASGWRNMVAEFANETVCAISCVICLNKAKGFAIPRSSSAVAKCVMTQMLATFEHCSNLVTMALNSFGLKPKRFMPVLSLANIGIFFVRLARSNMTT